VLKDSAYSKATTWGQNGLEGVTRSTEKVAAMTLCLTDTAAARNGLSKVGY